MDKDDLGVGPMDPRGYPQERYELTGCDRLDAPSVEEEGCGFGERVI